MVLEVVVVKDLPVYRLLGGELVLANESTISDLSTGKILSFGKIQLTVARPTENSCEVQMNLHCNSMTSCRHSKAPVGLFYCAVWRTLS